MGRRRRLRWDGVEKEGEIEEDDDEVLAPPHLAFSFALCSYRLAVQLTLNNFIRSGERKRSRRKRRGVRERRGRRACERGGRLKMIDKGEESRGAQLEQGKEEERKGDERGEGGGKKEDLMGSNAFLQNCLLFIENLNLLRDLFQLKESKQTLGERKSKIETRKRKEG